MVRNPLKKSEEKEEAPKAAEDPKEEAGTQIIERAITLSLINDKLNYLIGLVQKIGEACEVDLSKE